MLDFNQVISEVKEGNLDHFSELQAQFSGVAFAAANRFVLASSGRASVEELVNVDNLIYQAAKKHDPTQCGYSTRLWKMTEWECMRNLNSLGMQEIPMEEVESDEVFHEDISGDNINWIKDNLKNEDERTQEIISYLYLQDKPLTLAKIGQKLGLSSERIRQVSKKFCDKMREKLAREEIMLSLV